MDKIIEFWMQKEGEDAISLETYFDGLRYSKCDGLLDKGKRKNVYTESYSDSKELRVWQGDEVTREATEVKLKFFFIGHNRSVSYDRFCEYVKNGKIKYYDTARNKEVLLILMDAIKVGEDEWKGSTPYIEAEFTFKNVWGESKDHI